MASVLRSALVFAFTSAVIVLSAPGCSDQGEGERCDRAAAQGSGDCDDGLVCVPAGELLEERTDLCCPPEGQESSARCTRKRKGSNTAGTSSGGSGGTSGSAGESTGGVPEVTGGAGGVPGDGSAGESAGGGGASSEGGSAGAAGGANAGAPANAGQGGAT
jgi:hypothetical protein